MDRLTKDFKVGYRMHRSLSELPEWRQSCEKRKVEPLILQATEIVDYIESPGYPSGYWNNIDCLWKIVADERRIIHAHVIDLNLENSPECSADYVEILDSDGSQLDRLCTFRNNVHYYSNDKTMFVAFRSDGYGSGEGFRIMYRAVVSSYLSPDSIGAIFLWLIVGAFVLCLCGCIVSSCVRRCRAAGVEGTGGEGTERRLVTAQNYRQPIRLATAVLVGDSGRVARTPAPGGNRSSSPNRRPRDVQTRPAVSARIEKAIAAAFTEPGFRSIKWSVVPSRPPDSSRDNVTHVAGTGMDLRDISRPSYGGHRVRRDRPLASGRVNKPPASIEMGFRSISGSRYGPRDVQNPPPAYGELNFHSNSENIFVPIAPDYAEVGDRKEDIRLVPLNTSSGIASTEVAELPPSYDEAVLILRQQRPLSPVFPCSLSGYRH